MKTTRFHRLASLALAAIALSCHGQQSTPTPPSATANAEVLKIPLTLQTDESNAALLGRQCAVLWFTSESKVSTEQRRETDILAATAVAQALGVPYTESQFRDAFRKADRKVAADFDGLFPDYLAKHKGDKVRDIYLFSFWCTASRAWADLVPLFRKSEPAKQATARKFVAAPLAKAERVATNYTSEVTAKFDRLGVACLTAPLDTFDASEKVASDILEVQKAFLLRFLTPDQVAMVTQPMIERRH